MRSLSIKKTAALVLGLFTFSTASAFAADTAAGFTDVPKDHWAYEALDYLAKDGIIEGMGNNTFQGGRPMTRYEMAAIVARAMQKSGGSFGDRAVLEKLEQEYGTELATLKTQVDANTAQIQKNKEAIERVNLHGFARMQYDYDRDTSHSTTDKETNRFYLDLRGDFKVNDYWTVKFQSETNRHYNDGHRRLEDAKNEYSFRTWSGHNGNIQRIWVEGNKEGLGWINIGRAWRGLGQQNVLFGTESDGFQIGVPIKNTGLTASGFWMASTGPGNKESLYGVGMWGSVGHSTGINVAYAKSSLSKGEVYSSGNIIGYHADTNGANDPNNINVTPVYGTNDRINPRSYGYVVSGYVDFAKNLRFLADYVATDANVQNKSVALRVNYRGTDLNQPGTWGAYIRYIKYGANGWLAGDDEWNSTWNGTKGWLAGVKYVPWKNVELEIMGSRQKRNYDMSNQYDRTLVRTQMDYHF